jgi:hypothetical protein
VLVHLGVLGALVTTGLACRGARLQDRASEVGVVAGVSGQHPARRVADVGAVEVGADARGQLGDHVLAEARVRAGRTGLSALDTGLDALLQLPTVDSAEVLRVGLQHLTGNAHADSFSAGVTVGAVSGTGVPGATRPLVRTTRVN